MRGPRLPRNIEFPPSDPVSGDLSGLPEEGFKLRNGLFVFYIDGGNTALLATSQEVSAAATMERENFGFFRNDDTFIPSLARAVEIRTPGEGFAFGSLNFAHPPMSGDVHFALTVGSDRVGMQVLMPWLAMGIPLFESLD
jgi:hypothetical protein